MNEHDDKEKNEIENEGKKDNQIEEKEFNEEDFLKMIEQLKKQTTNKSIVKSSLFYHPNLGIHMLISYLFNIISSIVVIGISTAIQPIVNWGITSYFIAITLFTVVSNVLTIIIGILIIKKVLLFFSFIKFGIDVLSFFLVTLMTNNTFNFSGSNNPVILNLIIFTILFTIMNYLLSLVYRKFMLEKVIKRRK